MVWCGVVFIAAIKKGLFHSFSLPSLPIPLRLSHAHTHTQHTLIPSLLTLPSSNSVYFYPTPTPSHSTIPLGLSPSVGPGVFAEPTGTQCLPGLSSAGCAHYLFTSTAARRAREREGEDISSEDTRSTALFVASLSRSPIPSALLAPES